MKKTNRIIAILLVALVIGIACACFAACDENSDAPDAPSPSTVDYTFSAPEGTPALAMLRLVTDNPTIANANMTYKTVKPNLIATEMSAGNSDIVIMPVNAGANLIRMGADYKLVSIAVNGSVYMVGKTQNGGAITFDDVKGKKIACIGQTGVPGLVFRYVMKANGITLVDESTTPDSTQASVQYVADGSAAAQLIASGKVDFIVVGEPAASAQKNKLSLNAEMDLQAEYAKVGGASNYPQAGIFVKKEVYDNQAFMSELFDALLLSKQWVGENAAQVGAFAKENLYESAVFPPVSIPRCAINATKIDDAQKAQVIAFLKNVMPSDGQGNAINWDKVSSSLF